MGVASKQNESKEMSPPPNNNNSSIKKIRTPSIDFPEIVLTSTAPSNLPESLMKPRKKKNITSSPENEASENKNFDLSPISPTECHKLLHQRLLSGIAEEEAKKRMTAFEQVFELSSPQNPPLQHQVFELARPKLIQSLASHEASIAFEDYQLTQSSKKKKRKVTAVYENDPFQLTIDDVVVLDKPKNNNTTTGPLRRGKWEIEEEQFAITIIQAFLDGILPIARGTTLRSFLAKQLNCDPMRITKKLSSSVLAGVRVSDRVGKRTFRSCPMPIALLRKRINLICRYYNDFWSSINKTPPSGALQFEIQAASAEEIEMAGMLLELTNL